MILQIFDSWADSETIKAIKAEWPDESWDHWHKYENGKLASKIFPNFSDRINAELQSIGDNLKREGMFCDTIRFHGSGIHQMQPGSSLGKHYDTIRHPTLRWKREATAILYVDDAVGGELVMQCDDGATAVIAPKAGRLVFFTTPGNLHSVNRTETIRRSLSVFFWSYCESSTQGSTSATFI
jgi:hypothetical protein